MKYLNSKCSAVGLFFVAVALLFSYLLSIRLQVYLPVALFWIAVALVLGIIVYQIFAVELSSSYVKILLLEITITAVVFHLIYQIPNYGLYGADTYGDIASAKGILVSGKVMGDPQYINLYSKFPIIHIFGATSSIITGVNLFSIAKWFPSFFAIALIPLLYLLICNIFKEQKIALLSTLLFVSLQNYISFSSLFIRQTCALVLALCCIYLYFSGKHTSRPATYGALSIGCLLLTAISHHLTSFMLLIFLSIHLFVTKMSEVPFLRKVHFGNNINGEKMTIKFVLIAFVFPFAYWMLVEEYPLNALVDISESLFFRGEFGQTYAEIGGISGGSIETPYGFITYYGFYFFLLVFSLFLLRGLFDKAKSNRLETHSFTLYLFLCLFMAFLSLYFTAAIAFPDRFLTFGWIFGFAPLTLTILKDKHRWFRRTGVFLLVTSMLFNIFMIPPALWSPRSRDTPVTIVESFAPSVEDYALANTFNYSVGAILAPQNSLMAIYDVQNHLGTLLKPDVNLSNFNWVVVQKYENTTTVTLLYQSIEYNKIYDSKSFSLFKK